MFELIECKKCSEHKEETEFAINKTKVNGRSSWCKQCVSEEGKRRYQENKVKLKRVRDEAKQYNNSYTKKEPVRKPTSTKMDVNKYERGTNERLDALLSPEDEVWIVNGVGGRRPLIAKSEQEAREAYARFLETNSKIEE